VWLVLGRGRWLSSAPGNSIMAVALCGVLRSEIKHLGLTCSCSRNRQLSAKSSIVVNNVAILDDREKEREHTVFLLAIHSSPCKSHNTGMDS